MGDWMRLRQPGQITRVIATFRVGVFVGLSGMLASACWLTAATLQNAAYVRVVGQVDLLSTSQSSLVAVES